MIILYGDDIMSVKRYSSVNLPSGLYLTVKKLVKTRIELGYRSVTEFVTESVRKRVEEIDRIKDFASQLNNR